LFIALDDPLAMLDDLGMNLAGRLMEQSEFEDTHQHTLHSASVVEKLCGLNTVGLIPSTIKDPIEQQAYTDDLYTLLKTHDDIERATEIAGFGEGLLAQSATGPVLSAAQTLFKTKRGHLPDREKWQAALEDWNAKRLWREDVRFDEVQT
ncbi:T6SS effector BTH_I2691 family protein, partial [Pseudomonas sp. SDO5215_S409]